MNQQNQSAPQVVVFDLGKVLLHFDYSRAAKRFVSRSHADADFIAKLIDQTPLLHQFETGLIHEREFYETVCKGSGFKGDFGEFSDIFGDIFSPIPEMIAFHAALRGKGVPTYIFSNTNSLAVKHIHSRYPFFANFNGHIFSYEHGAMKPSARLYEVVEEKTGRRGGQILYLDDRAENIEAAKPRGWHTILHHTPSESIRQAAELGIRS
jgi:HAD superfamily hydrolase (TIGR01509 family)